MRSNRDGSGLLLPVVLVITTAIAFLPARWRVPWQTEVAGAVRVPMRPFTDGGMWLAARVRPEPRSFAADPYAAPLVGGDGRSGDDGDAGGAMDFECREQLEAARQVIDRQRSEIAALRRERDEARGLRGGATGVERETFLFPARITQRPRPDSGGAVKVTVRLRDGVEIPSGTVAVHGPSATVVGLVKSPENIVSTLSIPVMPVTERAAGWIRVAVDQGDPIATDPAGRVPRFRFIVRADDSGRFVGEVIGNDLETFSQQVGRTVTIDDVARRGDLVRVHEPSWPAASTGFKLGAIAEVRPRPGTNGVWDIVIEPEVRLRGLYDLELIGDLERGDVAGQEVFAIPERSP